MVRSEGVKQFFLYYSLKKTQNFWPYHIIVTRQCALRHNALCLTTVRAEHSILYFIFVAARQPFTLGFWTASATLAAGPAASGFSLDYTQVLGSDVIYHQTDQEYL